jgi:hypothetical protein
VITKTAHFTVARFAERGHSGRKKSSEPTEMLLTKATFFALATVAASSACNSCTINNHAILKGASGTLRAWCFSSNTCMDLGIGLLSSCSDFTFDNDQCGCAHFRSCAACANTSHLECVWVQKCLSRASNSGRPIHSSLAPDALDSL